ncbi:hypothetical protein PoMZ_10753 [Pyricularia oryzae]|uniref:PD-(D/E)XK nuclease-like domain-containing protein n=1 Tax=Pyricularia oryzae TaxID=318829 RepID=A0A4P7MYC0_PYROR|nr:hypothetical protein PoMZ_10753 [Pyricularia oryzae]
MSYPGSYDRVTDRLVTVPTGAIGASGSRSARKKEHCWTWEKKWDTAQVPAALLGFGDEILDVGNRGRAIVPPEARLKIDEADASDRRLEALTLLHAATTAGNQNTGGTAPSTTVCSAWPFHQGNLLASKIGKKHHFAQTCFAHQLLLFLSTEAEIRCDFVPRSSVYGAKVDYCLTVDTTALESVHGTGRLPSSGKYVPPSSDQGYQQDRFRPCPQVAHLSQHRNEAARQIRKGNGATSRDPSDRALETAAEAHIHFVEEADPLVCHEWKFSALTVEGKKAFFWAKCPIGSTSSLVGIYRIIWGLRKFARYGIKEYWPWLLREALGSDESATVPSI